MKLFIEKITNQTDFKTYLKYIESFKIVNPFYKKLGANLDSLIENQLHYFLLKDQNDTIKILMPFLLRKINSPYLNTEYYDVSSPYGYSGPLFNKETSESLLITFWELVDQWYNQNKIVSEFIRFSLNNNHLNYSGTLTPTLSNVCGTIIGEEEQWNNFKQKVRNNYRKSLEHQLEIEIVFKDINEPQIKLFHDIYIETMKRTNAGQQYFYSLSYITGIIKLSKNNCLIAFVYYKDQVVSAELILISGLELYSYLGGTRAAYFHTRPNDFLKIEVMKWGREHNLNHYILGGGRQSNDSLYKYKKSFFPNDPDLIFYTGRKITNPTIYSYLAKELQNTITIKEDDQLFFPSYRPPHNIIST